MSQLTALKSATTLTDVAHLLGFKPAALSYILYKMPGSAKYTSFDIPKRYGGVRKISAPSSELKLLQARLSEYLQNCAEEVGEVNDLRDQIAHGFKRKRSIITNASVHRRKRYVFNIDLLNFFGSINFGRIRGYFLKDNDFSLDPKVATVLAQIACHEDSLPQGSPCSPVISNLIGHILDIHLVRLASRSGCRYSRYADDLTFSTNRRDFPVAIAQLQLDDLHSWSAGSELSRLVQMSGFEINVAKTRMQYRDSRQDVTGLVVNRKVNVRRYYRHTVRAMVHRLLTTGTYDSEFGAMGGDDPKNERKETNDLTKLHGMLGFIHSVDSYNRKMKMANARDQVVTIKRSAERKEATYLRFLLYKEFFAAKAPVIVCEGPTDNVYILHALRSLAAKYPNLAMTESNGSIKLKARIYKYAGTSTGEILGLTGGASRLAHLIRTYRANVHRFKAPTQRNPVILVVDNDDGAKPVYTAVKEVTGIKPSRTEPFVHIRANMYLVPVPALSGKQSPEIEDLFEPAVLATVVDGKTFHAEKGFDSSIHYSKKVFAHKVVRPNADKIDFEGFSELFSNISNAVEDYATKHPIPAPEKR